MLSQVSALFFSLVFSLGFGQTANLNVLALPAAATSSPASLAYPAYGYGTPPAGSCGVIMSFFDGQGNPLNSNETWINPGATTSLPLVVKRRSLAGGSFYAEVGLDASSAGDCQLLSALSINNAVGGSAALVPLQQSLESFVSPPSD